MRFTSWAMILWPGLPQLWTAGSLSALALAVTFGAIVNVLLLFSFLWVEVLGASAIGIGWAALGVGWAVYLCFWGWGPSSRPDAKTLTEVDTLLREAQKQYLRGHWFEAETAARDVLARIPADASARLLLATLLRRTRRYDQANEQLARLERFESAAAWRFELAAERRLLAAAMTTSGEGDAEADNPADALADSAADAVATDAPAAEAARALDIANSSVTDPALAARNAA